MGAQEETTMIKFERHGYLYRTNHDASVIEACTRGGWVRTGSLLVREAAPAAIARNKSEEG